MPTYFILPTNLFCLGIPLSEIWGNTCTSSLYNHVSLSKMPEDMHSFQLFITEFDMSVIVYCIALFRVPKLLGGNWEGRGAIRLLC